MHRTNRNVVGNAVEAAARTTVERLEERQMFALLGVLPAFPNVPFNSTGVTSYVYDAAWPSR
jgi:hypothetical protein